MLTRVRTLISACGVAFLCAAAVASEVDTANRFFVLEKYEEAIKLFEKVASGENREEAAQALFGIGRAYQILGRWKEARESFDTLLRDHQDSDLSLSSKIQVGQCEIKLGSLQRALAIFEEIQKTDAGKEAAIEATYNASNLKAGFFGNNVRDVRDAISGYERVLESSLADRYATQCHFGLGQCYLLLRDYPRAIEAFRNAVREGPETVWAGYARDQIANALETLSKAEALREFGRANDARSQLIRRMTSSLQLRQQFAWHVAPGRPALRIRAVGFFTESTTASVGAERVVYSNPTIYYGDYVFNSDRAIVDKARQLVECVGNVKCINNLVPATFTVSSGHLALDLGTRKAVFSRSVRLDRTGGRGLPQQLAVGELHLLLDSGTIEVPAQ